MTDNRPIVNKNSQKILGLKNSIPSTRNKPCAQQHNSQEIHKHIQNPEFNHKKGKEKKSKKFTLMVTLLLT